MGHKIVVMLCVLALMLTACTSCCKKKTAPAVDKSRSVANAAPAAPVVDKVVRTTTVTERRDVVVPPPPVIKPILTQTTHTEVIVNGQATPGSPEDDLHIAHTTTAATAPPTAPAALLPHP